MIHKSFFLRTACFLLVFFSLGVFNTYAQSDAADMFDEFCADCHSIGEGDMKGPDLMGVEYRHNNAWLLKFIASSQTMIKAGDPAAVKIWTKFEKNKMPNTKLSEAKIQNIIDYIKSLNKNKPKPAAVVVKKSATGGHSTQNSGVSKQKFEGLSSQVTGLESKIKSLESKMDLLLDNQKKLSRVKPTAEDIKTGQELFEGHRAFKDNLAACVSCHNTFKIDSLNWNPSAVDLANTYTLAKNFDVKNMILNPISDKMKDVFKDHKVTDKEAFYLASYISSLEKTALKEHKKSHKNLMIFIIVALIMCLAMGDLLLTHIVKRRWINVFIFLLSFAFVFNSVYVNARNVGVSQGYTPLQPIKFSHKVHVKQNNIKCIFCHNSPEFSKVSGIPSLDACIICHKKIKKGTNSGGFEIAKITKAYKEHKPIAWVKIHNLPDHVFFSHAQHVSVAKQDCKTCHGNVEDMDVTTQFSPLTMGWCVNCHRETEVNFKDNKFYSNYKELHRDLKLGKIDKVTAKQIGANDCNKCHY